MVDSKYIAAAIAPVGVITLVLIVYVCWRRRRNLPPQDLVGAVKTRTELLHPAVDFVNRRRSHNSIYPRGVSNSRFFSWDDHPSLVNDAVENGWSQFPFTGYTSLSPSKRSRLLGLCAVGDSVKEKTTEITWEVCQGSADYMQKIRLNSGLNKAVNISTSAKAAASVIRTCLPLPGPPLASFPQEAYFEIAILGISGDENNKETVGMGKESERIKLIQQDQMNGSTKVSSESSVHLTSSRKVNNFEDFKLNGKDVNDEEEDEGVKLSVGLTVGGSVPLERPGSYPGSIGFNSNGSVYLDGIKLVFESEKQDWGRKEKVIGCGFDPKQKKVFFTVDSELVHVINCKSKEFGSPLYPTLAANSDIMVLVNLGQSVFKYGPAQRTPNPCFVGPLVNDPRASISYEDSRELFSMGAIDSQWFNRSAQKTTHSMDVDIDHHHTEFDSYVDSSDEIELFEIVVDESR